MDTDSRPQTETPSTPGFVCFQDFWLRQSAEWFRLNEAKKTIPDITGWRLSAGCAWFRPDQGRIIQSVVTTGDGNVRLRAARKEQGLASQADFVAALTATAAEIGIGELSVTIRTIRRWESEAPGWPHRAHIEALEALFGRPIAELGFTPRGGQPLPSPTAAATPESVLPVSAPRPRAPTRFRDTIPADAASHFAELTAAYRQLYWAVPANMLQHSVFRHAELGSALLEAAPDELAERLGNSASEAWLLAGRLLLFDLQDPAAARACLTEALECARAAGDDGLGAAALGHLAMEAARTTNGGTKGTDMLRAARAFADRVPESAMLVAWLDIVESEIQARAGHQNQAATLIAHAEQMYRQAAGAKPDWLDWFSAHRLTTAKANALLASGRLNDARLALERALNELPANETKLRALTYCDLAAVAALTHDPAQACTLLNNALDELVDGTYAVAGARVTAVRAMLSDWDRTPAVQALDLRLSTWNATLTAVSA
jgi:tetratricopeptide (TPR) repeat protein